MQFNSIQFDSIILLHLYTTLFLPSRRHCDLHHKRSTLIDFRCLCHQLLFNIWNPVREHSSCIKTTPQFNSIQFNFTTTPLYYYTYIAAPLIGIASAAISRYRLSIAIVTAPTAAVSTCTISAVTADTFAAAVRRGQQQLPIESQQLLSLRSPVARGSLSACLRFLALGGQQSKDHAAAKQIAAAQCGLQRTAARGSVPRLGEFQWLTAAATLQPD